MSEDKELMVLLKSDEIKTRFIQTAGRSGGSWITSVINAANLNPTIWECEPLSVVTAGLNAAALRLSLDPAIGQACILPFNKRTKINNQWVTEKRAVFVPMVRGLKQLAIRTNRYRYINSTPVFEGETIREDRMSGIQYLEGARTSDKHIGYYAAFEMINGLTATEYMTAEECLEHGKKYSPSYDKRNKKFYPGSNWVEDFPAMAEKTVLRRLILNKGYLDPGDRNMLQQLDEEGGALVSDEIPEDVIDGEVIEHEPKPQGQLMTELGFDDEPTNGSKPYAELVELADDDAPTAFWKLVSALKMSKEEGLSIVRDSDNDLSKAFNNLYRQVPA